MKLLWGTTFLGVKATLTTKGQKASLFDFTTYSQHTSTSSPRIYE